MNIYWDIWQEQKLITNELEELREDPPPFVSSPPNNDSSPLYLLNQIKLRKPQNDFLNWPQSPDKMHTYCSKTRQKRLEKDEFDKSSKYTKHENKNTNLIMSQRMQKEESESMLPLTSSMSYRF